MGHGAWKRRGLLARLTCPENARTKPDQQGSISQNSVLSFAGTRQSVAFRLFNRSNVLAQRRVHPKAVTVHDSVAIEPIILTSMMECKADYGTASSVQSPISLDQPSPPKTAVNSAEGIPSRNYRTPSNNSNNSSGSAKLRLSSPVLMRPNNQKSDGAKSGL
jgi:hypothetical protein